MAAISALEGKRVTRTSKLEQTILANRGMNIHLKRSLNVIEVDRKRMLKFVTRRQKELQADLKEKKDQKFNVMLRYQMYRTQNQGKKVKRAARPSIDIEGALFTQGLMNAPGVNSRMKRLDSRRRILPNFEEDPDGEENEKPNDKSLDSAIEFKPVEDDTTVTTPRVFLTTPDKNLDRRHEKNETSRHHRLDEHKSEALVVLTSGVQSLINEDAEFKQIERVEKAQNNAKGKPTTAPAAMTGFNMFSQIRSPNHVTQNMRTRERATQEKKHPDRAAKSVRFSRHRESLKDIEIGLPSLGDRSAATQFGNTSNGSRLSVIKSKLDSNEKEFLMKLRLKSQLLENEDVAKKVWDFIGKRPLSMGRGKRDGYKFGNQSEDDTLSDGEEARNLSKFLASANITSQRVNPRRNT